MLLLSVLQWCGSCCYCQCCSGVVHVVIVSAAVVWFMLLLPVLQWCDSCCCLCCNSVIHVVVCAAIVLFMLLLSMLQ